MERERLWINTSLESVPGWQSHLNSELTEQNRTDRYGLYIFYNSDYGLGY